MIRHAIKDYSPVYWPLVTMVEQSAFLFHINHFLQIKEYLSVSSLWETFIFHPLQNALRGRFLKRNAGRLDIRLKKCKKHPSTVCSDAVFVKRLVKLIMKRFQ